MINTILFDLDGTLLDTAPDLAYALNAVRAEYGLPALPFSQIRPVVSHGGKALIRLGFDMEPADSGFEARYQRLLEIYRQNISRETRLFAGMAELLDDLDRQRLRWGVVTNKPAWLTEPLLADLGLLARSAAVVSGDTLTQRKPDPAPLLYACQQAGCRPQECVYVGDAARDIEAGRRAKMATLVALFGYLSADDQPHSWPADDWIEHPRQILDWLDARRGSAVS